ncbi:MAG: RNA polymerase sigma factor [Phycisphaerae bacterium]|nr:RNA polymerase sigma factor [Phycisphaerae bacterium]
MNNSLAEELSSHVPRMYRVALRMVNDANEADDVLQDACVKALRGMDGFDGRATLATWLHRITINCVRDYIRKRQRAAQKNHDMDSEVIDMLTTDEITPSVRVEKRELYTIASAAVKSLPDDCRSAFILTQLDGYSYDEAATIENQPRGTVASRVYRAKKILLEQINARTGGRV